MMEDFSKVLIRKVKQHVCVSYSQSIKIVIKKDNAWDIRLWWVAITITGKDFQKSTDEFMQMKSGKVIR